MRTVAPIRATFPGGWSQCASCVAISRAHGDSHSPLESRVEEVAEPVADQVDAEDHSEDRQAGNSASHQPVVR
jgi:hypothetical protein